MPMVQADLFGTPSAARSEPDAEIVAIVRARLHAALALVKGAATMPWTDIMTVIHQDNAFRSGKAVLPPEEGAALWAQWDVEMDRLYAIMNEGCDPDCSPDEPRPD